MLGVRPLRIALEPNPTGKEVIHQSFPDIRIVSDVSEFTENSIRPIFAKRDLDHVIFVGSSSNNGRSVGDKPYPGASLHTSVMVREVAEAAMRAGANDSLAVFENTEQVLCKCVIRCRMP